MFLEIEKSILFLLETSTKKMLTCRFDETSLKLVHHEWSWKHSRIKIQRHGQSQFHSKMTTLGKQHPEYLQTAQPSSNTQGVEKQQQLM